MKNKLLILVISLVVLFFLIACSFYIEESEDMTPTTLTETSAINALKVKFPELKEYPNSDFPVRTIKTEKADNGWYIGFIKEGSGVPIIGAQCFLVKNDNSVEQISYVSNTSLMPGEFSVKDCRVLGNIVGGDKDSHGCIGSAGYTWCEAKQKCLRAWEEPCEITTVCKLENCHGLDIQCGSNPPDYCTMMYGMGDKCLQYAKCGTQNGSCQQIENLQFNECKSCVEACVENNKNDIVKSFECESNCN